MPASYHLLFSDTQETQAREKLKRLEGGFIPLS